MPGRTRSKAAPGCSSVAAELAAWTSRGPSPRLADPAQQVGEARPAARRWWARRARRRGRGGSTCPRRPRPARATAVEEAVPAGRAAPRPGPCPCRSRGGSVTGASSCRAIASSAPAQRLGVDGRGQAGLDQARGGRHRWLAEQQDRGVDAGGAQLLALLDQGHGQVGGARLQRGAGHRHGAVPVAVGLDHRAHCGVPGGLGAARRTLWRIAVEVDLEPRRAQWRAGGHSGQPGRGGRARTAPGRRRAGPRAAPRTARTRRWSPPRTRCCGGCVARHEAPQQRGRGGAPRGQPRPGEGVQQHGAGHGVAEGARVVDGDRGDRGGDHAGQHVAGPAGAELGAADRAPRGSGPTGRPRSCRGPWRRPPRRTRRPARARAPRGGPRRRGRPRPRRCRASSRSCGVSTSAAVVLGQRLAGRRGTR